MNRIGMAVIMVASALVWPLSVNAQKNSIYSWTDENGVKHYSDRAPDEPPSEVEQIPLSNTPPPAGSAGETLNNEAIPEDGLAPGEPASAASPAEELSYADQQRQAMAEKREAQREKQAERQRICLQATDQLARIEPSRRVFYTDEAGNTTRLDDEERVRMVEENKQLVAEYCD